MYLGTLAQCEHPSRTLSLFPGDEKHHPMQSYQVKHTNHLCITYSQVKTLQTFLRPQVVGCCVQKARSPSLYMYHPRETSCSKSLLTGNHDTSVKQMILNLSQYQEKVLEEEKLSPDAPGSKLQDIALNCQAPALELCRPMPSKTGLLSNVLATPPFTPDQKFLDPLPVQTPA